MCSVVANSRAGQVLVCRSRFGSSPLNKLRPPPPFMLDTEAQTYEIFARLVVFPAMLMLVFADLR